MEETLGEMCVHCEQVSEKNTMYHEEHFGEDYYCNEDCYFWHARALKG